jgi:hypothetical protein
MEMESGNPSVVYMAMLVDISKSAEKLRGFCYSLIQDINARTLGNLFRKIKKTVTMDNSLLARVEEALDKRNHLIYKFFRGHNLAIRSVEGRLSMLAELHDIQETLN